jgi:predicted RND superfamily exporter protein
MIASSIATFIKRYARLIAGVMLVFTCFMGYMSVRHLSLNVVLEAMLPAQHPNVKLMSKFGAQFGGANTSLIMVENAQGTIYDEKFLSAYKRIVDEVYFYPSVHRHLVQALTLRKTKALSGSAGRIDVNAIAWPDLPRTPAEMLTFQNNVRAAYLGYLVSDDEKAAMIVADFKDSTDYSNLVHLIDSLAAKEAPNGVRVHAVGRPLLLGAINGYLGSTVGLIAVSLAFSGLILFFYFRSWIAVFVPMLTAAVGTIWGTGAMALVHFNLDPLLIILPVYVFAIVLSHCVQFVSRVFEGFEQNLSMSEAVRNGLIQIFAPSTTAIVAAAAGFFVLLLIGVPSLQSLGLICGFWLLAIAPALVFTASLLCLLPRPKRFRARTSWVETIWEKTRLARYGRIVPLLMAAFLAVGVYESRFVIVGDAVGSPILWPKDRYNADNAMINSRFAAVGTDTMLVYVEGGQDALTQPAVFHAMEDVGRYVWERTPKARQGQSLVTVVRSVQEALYEGDPSYKVIPQTPDEIRFNLYMFSSKGEPGDFKAYTDEALDVGSVVIPFADKTGPTVQTATSLARQFVARMPALPNQAHLQVAGGQIGIAEAINHEIGRTRTLVLAAILFFIMATVYASFRSLWVTAVLAGSLITSTFLTDIVMRVMGIGLNINTLPLAALGVGLAADYGIYVLYRVRQGLAQGVGFEEAVDHSLKTAGNAVMITAITMIAPVLPWAFFSALRFQAEMGVLHAVVLFFNMLGSLIFVPCMVLIFKPRSLDAKASRLPLTSSFPMRYGRAAAQPASAFVDAKD